MDTFGKIMTNEITKNLLKKKKVYKDCCPPYD